MYITKGDHSQNCLPLILGLMWNGLTCKKGNSIRNVPASLINSSQLYNKIKVPPGRANSFPLRMDPFSKGLWCMDKQTGGHKSCLPCTKWHKIYKEYPIKLVFFQWHPQLSVLTGCSQRNEKLCWYLMFLGVTEDTVLRQIYHI